MNKRKSIPLCVQDDSLLRQLYLIYRIPSDQFKRRPKDANRFLETWNHLASRSDEWGDIYHYIVTKRKCGKWVTLDNDYLKLADPNWDILSENEWRVLKKAYCEVVLNKRIGTDSLLFDNDLSAEIAREFAAQTGRVVHGSILTGLMVSKRKRGKWPLLNPKVENVDLGFKDIGKVA